MTDNDRIVTLALALPKAELHIHIEGSLEPELALRLAERNGVMLPYADAQALRQAYDFSDLQSFLDLYYACADVLRTADDFQALMAAYLRRAVADGVIHAEVFFDPQTHTQRGVSIETVLDGLEAGIAEVGEETGISVRLILCFLRHLSEDDGFATLKEALPHLHRIHGFGLDSSERDHPPHKFARLFKRCRELGKPVVAHAGEEGPSSYVDEAIDLLQVARIDHGVRAADDENLLDRLVDTGIPLTVCPLSNVRLKVFDDLRDHPLPRLLARGLKVTINSDDPAYFGGSIGANIEAVQKAFNFDAEVWYRLARNSLEASLVSGDVLEGWLSRLDETFDAQISQPPV